jgi:hypothetical protein
VADPDKVNQWLNGSDSQQSLLGTPGQGAGVLLGLGTGGAFNDSSKIYLPGGKYTTNGKLGGFATAKYEAVTKTAAEVKSMPLGWMQNDPETLKKFVNQGILNKVPGFDVGMGMPEIMKAWENLVEQSWMMNKYMPGDEGKKLTPWDVLNSYSNNSNKFGTVRRGDWEYDIATGEKVKYVGPKSKTTTQKRVDLSSPEDVKAIATNALAQLLGRAPTAEEMAKFKTSINTLEEQNPTMATTTETLNDMGEVTNTSTTQTGGLSAEARQAAVADQAKQGPEYGKFQSGTTYWGALMQLLGS